MKKFIELKMNIKKIIDNPKEEYNTTKYKRDYYILGFRKYKS